MPPKKPTTEQLPDDIRFFAQITRRVYRDPRWSGKTVPSSAWRVYCWMLENTTRNVDMPQDDGETTRFGVVAGNNHVSLMSIAKDLNCTWRAVQRACDWLVAQGFITRGREGNDSYRYAVVDSTRKFASDAEPNGEKALKLNGKTYTEKPQPKTLADLYDISRNLRTKEILAYFCKGCEHRALSEEAFADHVRDEHPDLWPKVKPEESKTCDICGLHWLECNCGDDDDIS
jgi:hypothetical protein